MRQDHHSKFGTRRIGYDKEKIPFANSAVIISQAMMGTNEVNANPGVYKVVEVIAKDHYDFPSEEEMLELVPSVCVVVKPLFVVDKKSFSNYAMIVVECPDSNGVITSTVQVVDSLGVVQEIPVD